MEAYTDFAQVYDEFMDETPYEEWCAFLVEMLEKYGVKEASGLEQEEESDKQTARNLRQEKNTILDLGCGTGTLTELLARKGYDMIGLDNAQEMLQIAREKRDASGLDNFVLAAGYAGI